MIKLSHFLTASAFFLAIGSQAIGSPANAIPLAVSSPSSSLIAYTNTSSLSNLMTEYRKALSESQRLNRDVKSATGTFNRLTAELDRVATASREATPEVKAKLSAQFNRLVIEVKQQKDKAMIATGNLEQITQWLAKINIERTQMRESLMKDLNVLNTEANLIKTSIRALN